MFQVSGWTNKIIIWALSIAVASAAGTEFDALSHINMMNKALQSSTPLRKNDINQYYDEIQRGVNGTTTAAAPTISPNTLRGWIALDSAITDANKDVSTNGTESAIKSAEKAVEMDIRNRRALRIADHSDSVYAAGKEKMNQRVIAKINELQKKPL